jgi:hypothetical protein
MKLHLISLFFLSTSTSAFAPMAFVMPSKTHPAASGRLFAAKEDMSLEEEVEQMVQEEINKTKRMSNLRNEKGVEYAPWMRMTADDEARIRKVVLEKAEARRRRKEAEVGVKGALLMDSQAQEVSGTGLRYKINGNDVELEWATNSEANTKGFIVKRRPAKTDDFTVLASYQNYGPLASKGKDGGVYRFLDEGVQPGGWVYRVTESEASGAENDLSQCLVEIQTDEEQRGAILAVSLFALVAVGAVVLGNLLDPVQY